MRYRSCRSTVLYVRCARVNSVLSQQRRKHFDPNIGSYPSFFSPPRFSCTKVVYFKSLDWGKKKEKNCR